MSDPPPQPSRRVYLPEQLEFRAATDEDLPFLYELLLERYERGVTNIPGHVAPQPPTYAEHVAHFARKPYARIEIVTAHGGEGDLGMMYLTHENVGGCFVKAAFAGRGLAVAMCYAFFVGCRFPVIAHFNRHNRASWRMAERLGWVRTAEDGERLTYELRGPQLDAFARVRAGGREPRQGNPSVRETS